MTDHDASARPDHTPGTPKHADPPGQPAEHLVQALADQLAVGGYDTHSPAWDHRGYLKITNAPGILSELTADTSGHVTWECRASDPAHVTPAQLTVAVLALLHPAAAWPAAVEQRTDLTPFSLAGRALKAAGLHVTFDVLDISQTDYTTCTELRVTNPDRPERGTARSPPTEPPGGNAAPTPPSPWKASPTPSAVPSQPPRPGRLTKRTRSARTPRSSQPTPCEHSAPPRGAVWPPACPNAAAGAGCAEADKGRQGKPRTTFPFRPRFSEVPPTPPSLPFGTTRRPRSAAARP